MGFLTESEPLEWEEALKHLQYVREHGIEQFVHIFHQVKYVHGDLLRWGDELEHGLFKLVGSPDDSERTVKASMRSPAVIESLKALESHGQRHGLSEADMSSWMPEYGRWMLESTPRKPYEGLIDLLKVEDRMRLRRSRLLSVLEPGEIVPYVTSFPLFGVGDFCTPSAEPGGPIAKSLFMPDIAIFPHARFATLSKNIRSRRGAKVDIRRPRFQDECTPEPKYTDPAFVPETVAQADEMDHVYADAMGFGMGCCCLQVTFQASSVMESRHLYDHLAVLTPMMLALTAATPFMRGWLIDEDSRWDSVAQSVDDRTDAERGVHGPDSSFEGDPRLAGHGKRFMRKSRYDSIDCYLCNCTGGQTDPAQMYNDLTITYSEQHVQRLINSGIDEVLARHIAHLFARDPLVIFADKIRLDDRNDVDHWENLQSTNWQTVRWKPPPPLKGMLPHTSEEHIGWRVEFRSMEIQITDFENAAFAVFIMLLSRVILVFELSLYIPISKLEDNMKKAQTREACSKQSFWFRKSILPRKILAPDSSTRPLNSPGVGSGSEQRASPSKQASGKGGNAEASREMTLGEILGGSADFPGLVPLCETYLDFIGCDSVVRTGLKKYMNFILRRARGELLTPASWMRKFITSHPDYRKDSRIPSTVAYDLMVACKEIGEGARACPELFGDDIVIPRVEAATNPFNQHMAPTSSQDPTRGSSSTFANPDSQDRMSLLAKLHERAEEKRQSALTSDISKRQEELDKLVKDLDMLKKSKSVTPQA